MLQLTTIRQDAEGVIAALAKRNLDARPAVEALLALNEQRRHLQAETENQQAEANRLAKAIGQLFREGKAGEADALKAESAAIKERLTQLAADLHALEEQERAQLVALPNTPHASVPAGKSAEDNEVVRTWGSAPDLGEGHVPHWELTEKYKLIDFERGVKITGAGFPVYTGQGARLQRALIQFFLDRNTVAGYTEVQPPHFINEASGFGTGQLPDKEGQMYHMTEDNLYAIPTAEVPVTNLLRDEIVAEAELPIKMTAYSPCFRREAGSYGKDVRGLNRLHQFDKVELVQITAPSESYDAMEMLRQDAERLLQALDLPYRRLLMCTADMGFTQAKKYDLEVWSPGQDRWLEVSSISNFEDYQARRLKLRYRPAGGGSPAFVH
ncbi:MAG: serine--tRNA ligase, partial [Flavobacteriia bacterium]|nr:serine--tRNA ligase [Flavobacteriia bacterium]